MLRRLISAHPAGLLLLGMDAVGILVAFNIGHWLHIDRFAGAPPQILFGVTPITLFIMYIGGVYRADLETWGLRLVIRTVLSVTCAGVLIAALAYVSKATEQDMLFWRGTLIPAYLIFVVWAVAWRVFVSLRVQTTSKRLRWLAPDTLNTILVIPPSTVSCSSSAMSTRSMTTSPRCGKGSPRWRKTCAPQWLE